MSLFNKRASKTDIAHVLALSSLAASHPHLHFRNGDYAFSISQPGERDMYIRAPSDEARRRWISRLEQAAERRALFVGAPGEEGDHDRVLKEWDGKLN